MFKFQWNDNTLNEALTALTPSFVGNLIIFYFEQNDTVNGEAEFHNLEAPIQFRATQEPGNNIEHIDDVARRIDRQHQTEPAAVERFGNGANSETVFSCFNQCYVEHRSFLQSY